MHDLQRRLVMADKPLIFGWVNFFASSIAEGCLIDLETMNISVADSHSHGSCFNWSTAHEWIPYMQATGNHVPLENGSYHVIYLTIPDLKRSRSRCQETLWKLSGPNLSQPDLVHSLGEVACQAIVNLSGCFVRKMLYRHGWRTYVTMRQEDDGQHLRLCVRGDKTDGADYCNGSGRYILVSCINMYHLSLISFDLTFVFHCCWLYSYECWITFWAPPQSDQCPPFPYGGILIRDKWSVILFWRVHRHGLWKSNSWLVQTRSPCLI